MRFGIAPEKTDVRAEQGNDRDDPAGYGGGRFRCTSLGHIGFVTHTRPEMLVFLSNEKYIGGIEAENVVAVLTTAELAQEVLNRGKVPIVSENPKRDFEMLRDHLARVGYVRTPSRIDPSAVVSEQAWVCETNVSIGKRCIIEPNVTILDGVEIGDDSFIVAGTVLGTAFDSKLCGDSITKNFHDGRLIVGNNVEIHSNCCIDKGNAFHGTP
jgi:UDP-3-O-[3-hydroxymyristoyl] glucosamine N-acyltransferase